MSLTPEQIKAQGYTILTSPSEIEKYDIAGQYGETGTSGSFLYGKPKAGRSLEGTMQQETPDVITPAANVPDQREIPTMTSGVSNFKEGLNLIDNYYRGQQESPQQIIQKLGSQLGDIINPNVMTGALGQYDALRKESSAGVFKSAMDVITELQTNQQNYMQTVLSKLDFVPTVKEYQELLSGNPSEEFMAKINESETRKQGESVKNPVKIGSDIDGNDIMGTYNPKTNTWEPVDIASERQGETTSNGWNGEEIGLGQGGECGVFARGKTTITAPMGDTFETKKKWVDENGTVGTQGIGVGDLVITDGSDVAGGKAIPTGHAFLVGAIDPDGNIFAYESNAKGDGQVTFGRWVNQNAIYGFVGGGQYGAMKPEEFQKMQALAMKLQPSGMPQETDKATENSQNGLLNATGLSLPAFSYLTQGTPALARMNENLRLKYMGEAEEYLNRTGTDIATFQAQYGALSKTVGANSLRNNQAAVAESELEATLDNLETAADESSFKKMKWKNIVKMYAGKEFNDKNVSKYSFHLNQLREEFAMYNMAIAGQLDANGNIREISAEDYRKAENIIKDGFAQGSIDGFREALEASRSKMQVILQNSIDAQNKQVWKLFGVADKYNEQVARGEEAPVTIVQQGQTSSGIKYTVEQ